MRYPRRKPPPALNVEPLAFAIPEVAQLLRVSPEFVRLEVRRKRLQATRLGSRVVIRRAEIDRYLAENSAEAR